MLAYRDEQVEALDRGDHSSMYRRMGVNAIAWGIAQTLRISEQQVWRIIEQGARLRDHLPTVWAAFADGAIDSAEAERAKRHVRIDAGHDGTSYLGAYVSSLAAQAIMTRLGKAAAELPDKRTREHKKADLLVSWLTNADGTECDIRAEVAVIIEAAALAGITDTPGHVLDVTHPGYQPPAKLRSATTWRDMTCRIAGCNRAATACDLDHHHPFDTGGTTTGTNLRSLCRRHHGIKGHGLLPPDAYAPPEVHLVRLPGPTFIVEYVEAA